MTTSSTIRTPLGGLYMEADGEGISLVRPMKAGDGTHGSSRFLNEAAVWFDAYFSGEVIAPPALSLHSTPFRLSVWNELMRIPYASVVSYAEVARRVGCGSNRAVGGAVGANPVMIIVPCHRVIGSDGSLTGYAYGTELKKMLLEYEGYRTVRF